MIRFDVIRNLFPMSGHRVIDAHPIWGNWALIATLRSKWSAL